MTAYDKQNEFDTIVIGAGQAGLSVGYFLARQDRDFVILDANQRVGDVWRNRWDSLRLFTPARYDGLAGMPFPAPAHYFPTKDEMADYLESYAERFKLPVRTGVKVDRLSRQGDRFFVKAGDQRYEAKQVVVAMSKYQKPKVPSFASRLAGHIIQLPSIDYRSPSQLQDGGVLIVGAGNSGAEIAIEVARSHPTWMSGRSTGQVPFNIERSVSGLLLLHLTLRFLFHRVLTLNTPIGKKIRPVILSQGGPLIRVKYEQLEESGIKRLPKTAGVKDGLPLLADGRVLEVANVIWCTGFHAGFSWIDLPIMGEIEPKHTRGVVASQPGLYFVGLEFLYSFSSTMIHGVERDARFITDQIAERSRLSTSSPAYREKQAQQSSLP